MKRLTYLSILMMILLHSLVMAQGYTRISSQLKQKNGLPFPLLDSYDLYGGAVSGSERTALPVERRKPGMLFLDTDDGIVYQLVGGIADENWQQFTGGGYWSKTGQDIYYNDGDVKVGQSLITDQIKFSGNNVATQGLRIGNPQGTSAGSNILIGLNHEMGAGWDIFNSNLAGATGNVFIGIDNIYQSNITGDNNIAIGKWTGYSLVSGGDNIYLGKSAGEKNPAGWYNISMGTQAGNRGSGHWNVDLGHMAGYGYLNAGTKNVNLGLKAGYTFETPGGQTSNISIGEFAGYQFQGDSSIILGVSSGYRGAGSLNFMMGPFAGAGATGDVNLYLGRYAGKDHTGDSCIFIGDGVGFNYTGSNKVLIDVMYRTDGSYMIDLEGAQDKRYVKFNARKFTTKTDEFLIKDITVNKTKLSIISRSDTTVLTSDNKIKLEGSELVTDSEIISNGLRSFARSINLTDDHEIVIANGAQGWGAVQVGDDEGFTQFHFSSKGEVILFNSTANVIDKDMDAFLCIFSNEAGIVVKNRLGMTNKVNFTINYTNSAK